MIDKNVQVHNYWGNPHLDRTLLQNVKTTFTAVHFVLQNPNELQVKEASLYDTKPNNAVLWGEIPQKCYTPED